MKQMLVLLLLLSTLLFAAKKDDMKMLNQQIMDLQEKNVVLRTNNQKLKTANRNLTTDKKALHDKTITLESDVTAKQLEIKSLVEANKKLRAEIQSQKAATPDTIRITKPAPAPAAPVVTVPTLRAPAFPLTASLVKDPKKHGADQIAVLLKFRNGSSEQIKGFVGVIQFHQNGKILLEAQVNIGKVIEPGKSDTWYGGIPYDASNPGNVKLLNLTASSIQIVFDTQSIRKSDGTVKQVK